MSDKTIYENCLGAHRNPNHLLELHVLSHEVAAAPSCGREPADVNRYQPQAPKGR